MAGHPSRSHQQAKSLLTQGNAVDQLDDVVLPPQYGQALQLAESMLTAARRQDWQEVRNLRTALPQLAADLEIAWQKIRSEYPEVCDSLEPARVKMIREILRVDEQIRRMAQPAYHRLSPWLATRPMRAVPLYETCEPQT